MLTNILHIHSKIKGFPDALETPSVWSNYHPKYVTKGPECIRSFKKGNAIFTFPKPPIKCPGAPQKIMYIAESHLKKVCNNSSINKTDRTYI